MAKPKPEDDLDAPPDRLWLRWFLIGCYLATMYYTWPVWQVRGAEQAIPNLPLGDWTWLDFVQVRMGEVMILALLAIFAHPIGGLFAHTAVLLVAVILDQARLQPTFFSLTILLWSTLPWHGARLLGRTHLIALWFFAGMHKLLSPGYLEVGGPQMMEKTFPGLTPEQLQPMAILAATYELLLGILAAIPYARRAVPFMAAAFHLGVVESLVRQQWNSAVWPWNIALAGVGFGLLLWDDDPPWAACGKCEWPWSVGAGFILLSPALFYLGSFDAYLCHCLYSSNIPTANVEVAQPALAPSAEGDPWRSSTQFFNVTSLSFKAINVPLPPEHRLYIQFFRRRARPGDMLLIEDSRRWAAWWGYAERYFLCRPDGSIVELPPAPSPGKDGGPR